MGKKQYRIPESFPEAKAICHHCVEDALFEVMSIMSKTVLGNMAPLIVLQAALQVSYRMLTKRIKIEERRLDERRQRSANA